MLVHYVKLQCFMECYFEINLFKMALFHTRAFVPVNLLYLFSNVFNLSGVDKTHMWQCFFQNREINYVINETITALCYIVDC